jgi:hypothetical protein
VLAAASTLIITEVKVRLDTNNPLDYDEYIEIYNATPEPVDISGYSLEYFNSTNPSVSQQPVQKSFDQGLIAGNQHLLLAKQPAQIMSSIQSPLSSLTDTGGRLKLVTTEGDVVDEVAWTNTQSLATSGDTYPAVVYQCNSSTTLCASNRTQSFARQKDNVGNYITPTVAWQLGPVSPESSELLDVPVPEPEQPNNEEATPSETPPPPLTCEGILINEILPNPSGSDNAREFVELFNPTSEVILLKDCSLQTSSSGKLYTFSDVSLQPGQHLALYDNQTGLTLANSAGGTVWLLSPTEEVQAIVYPGALDDDASWSVVDGAWQRTYAVTPNAINVAIPLKPCVVGQQRDETTNKCETIAAIAVAALSPCKPNQERNPDTSRCRTITSTLAASLVPCKEGQERNPDTNRCRTKTSDASLKPCSEGQERNPETNRCRQVLSAATTQQPAVKDVYSGPSKSSPKWAVVIVAVIFALVYAVYEWRQDIRNVVSRLVSKSDP